MYDEDTCSIKDRVIYCSIYPYGLLEKCVFEEEVCVFEYALDFNMQRIHRRDRIGDWRRDCYSPGTVCPYSVLYTSRVSS